MKIAVKTFLLLLLCAVPFSFAFKGKAAGTQDASGFVIEDGALTAYLGNEKSVVVPEGVTSIKQKAFYGCESLAEVTLPEGLKTIDNRAFQGCTALETIHFPESLCGIGYQAFQDTRWLSDRQAEGPYVIVNHILIDGMGAAGEAVIPEDVTKLAGMAFRNNTSITKAILPEGLKTIKASAFEGCTALEAVTLGQNLTKIEGYAFYGCRSLRAVEIPASVRTLGRFAFMPAKFFQYTDQNGTVRIDYRSGLERIYGAYDSAAETYASEYAISFRAEPMPDIPSNRILTDQFQETPLRYEITMGGGDGFSENGINDFFIDEEGRLNGFRWDTNPISGITGYLVTWIGDSFTCSGLNLPYELSDSLTSGMDILKASYNNENQLCLLYCADWTRNGYAKIDGNGRALLSVDLNEKLRDILNEKTSADADSFFWRTLDAEESGDSLYVLTEFSNSVPGYGYKTEYCLCQVSLSGEAETVCTKLDFAASRIEDGKIYGIDYEYKNGEPQKNRKLYIADLTGRIVTIADIPVEKNGETGNPDQITYYYKFDVVDGTVYVLNRNGYYRLNQDGRLELLMDSQGSYFLTEAYTLWGLKAVNENEFYVLLLNGYDNEMATDLVRYRR